MTWVFDVLGFAGIALIAVGLWLVAPALSLTAVGVLFLLFALLAGRNRAASRAGVVGRPGGNDGQGNDFDHR